MSSPAPTYPPGNEAREEVALARRIASGDKAAEAEWCARLLPRILLWCKLRTRDETRAADLAQEVIVIVLEKLRANTIEDIDRLNAYVAGVCRHTHTAWQRGEHRRSGLLEIHASTLEQVTIPREPVVDRSRLQACFDKLSQRARTILALCFFAEHTSEEIALQLCSTASAVRVARHRALADLHRCVEGET